ncbi:MAG: hypothetical protein ABI884_13805 [Gemmatimonadota bacterium]
MTRNKYFAIALAVLVAAVELTRPGTVGDHLDRFLILYSVPLAVIYAGMAISRAVRKRATEARHDAAHAVQFFAFAGFGAASGHSWFRVAWIALAWAATIMVGRDKPLTGTQL